MKNTNYTDTDIDIILLSENDISDCIELIESISTFNENEVVQQTILIAELQQNIQIDKF
jgi:hypothetical protein